MRKRIKVTEEAGRIDAYIATKIDGYSRSYLSTLISDGLVKCNGEVVRAKYKPLVNDIIDIEIPDPVETETKAQDIPLDIVFEDDDLIIVNKPQGMVVHPAAGHFEGTLVNALLHHCDGRLSDINGVIRPGIVHRIDKDTSGLMVAVKNNETHMAMAEMMARHEVMRQYRCVVHGVVSPDKGTVDAPVGRSKNDRKKMTVTEDGKPAITHFEVVRRYSRATDLSLLLETGRTHQIRVHMSYIGHPPVGDPVYSPRRDTFGLSGQALHSKSIGFVHPRTGEQLYFESELPDYYLNLLDRLEKEG